MTNETVQVIEIRGASKDCDKEHVAPGGTPEPEPEKKYITSTGEVSIKTLPTGASIEIHIEAEGKTTEEAKSRFREITQKIIKTVGDKTQFSFSSPETEKIETSEKEYRSSQKTTVTSIGKMQLSSENLGAILSALLENDISFSPPKFTFDDITPIDLSIYEKASSLAKNKAKALVEGVGCALGKVYDIKYSDGSEQNTIFSSLGTFSDYLDEEGDVFYSKGANADMKISLNTFQTSLTNKFQLLKRKEEKEEITWDPQMLDLLQTQIPNRVQKVSVSVTYEIEV